MEQEKKCGRCGLIMKRRGNKCPSGVKGASCCYECEHKTTCFNVCLNYPKKCKEYKDAPQIGINMKDALDIYTEHQKGNTLENLAEKYNVTVETIQYRIKRLKEVNLEMEKAWNKK